MPDGQSPEVTIPDEAVEALADVLDARVPCPVCGRIEACRCRLSEEQRRQKQLAKARVGLVAAYPHLARQFLAENATLWNVDCPQCAARLDYAYGQRASGAVEELRAAAKASPGPAEWAIWLLQRAARIEQGEPVEAAGSSGEEPRDA